MKSRLLILLSAFALFSVSCVQKEQSGIQDPILDGAKSRIQLSVENNTRTILAPGNGDGVRKVLWTAGDKVNINGCDSRPLTLSSDSETATFLFDELLDLPYNIIYPASIYSGDYEVNLPATQGYQEGSFGVGAAPAVGHVYSTDGASLKNLCAVLQIRVKAGAQPVALNRLTFTGANDEQVCGKFSLDYINARISGTSTADSTRSVALNLNGVSLSQEGTAFYIVVPEGTYEKGFSVKLEDTNGKSMTIAKTSSIEMLKSKIVVMPAFTYDASSDKVANFDDYTQVEMMFSGGKGTKEEPYLISSAYDLNEMSKLINVDSAAVLRLAYYKQTADINMVQYEKFAPIGNSTAVNFRGSYDGGNYTISFLAINNEAQRNTALFGNVGTNASLSNINMTSTNITTSHAYAASLVAYAYKCSVTNCSANGSVTSTGEVDGKSYTAGLIGRATGCTIDGCSFKGTVSAKSNHAGGVIGTADSGCKISNCIFKKGSTVSCNYYAGGVTASLGGADAYIKSSVCEGKVTGTNWNVGGITAILYQGSVISCVQSNTSVVESSNYNVGGIVGSINTNSTNKDQVAVIDNCVAYGQVKGLYQVGGICGLNYVVNVGEEGIISNCAVIGAEITATGVNSSNYSLVAGICGWLQGNGAASLVNCFARPAFVNSTNASAILGTAAIVGYTNVSTHLIDNCYSPVSPAEIQFRGAPVTSSSLTYYGSILGRASAAVPVNRCYYNIAFRLAPTSNSNHVASGCAGYTVSQMTSGTLLTKLNQGTSSISVATASEWVAGSDSYPTLKNLPADTQPTVAKKRVSIIGDSISTFSGWIASSKVGSKACTTHYPNTSNTACDVLTVDKTWWYRLIYNKMKNAQFEMNISSGNTTVVKNTTATSYSSQYWYNWDFCTRFIGYAGVGNPDVILIHGGTNDFGHMASYGATEKLIGSVAMDSGSAVSATQLQPLFNAADACTTLAQAEALDFTTFCSSYIKLMQMIKVRYPKAKVVCIIGDALKPGMQSAIRAIATHYNAKYVDFLELCGFKQAAPLSKYDKAVHPDAAGMEYMAKTIYSQVGAWMEE